MITLTIIRKSAHVQQQFYRCRKLYCPAAAYLSPMLKFKSACVYLHTYKFVHLKCQMNTNKVSEILQLLFMQLFGIACGHLHTHIIYTSSSRVLCIELLILLDLVRL